ncbi:MAG: DUF480 domain-containing protein [Planctomycetota bacterium]|jgi:uncharacterized protein YceH (UPF0502 family)
MELNDHEQRALGVLIEKQLSTPDQYPLSLNALRAGCNQKSNREPVTDYSEAELVVALQGLEAKGLSQRLPAGFGSRVERYEHSLEAALAITDKAQLAVLAELLVRGPQAPGELRQRASRMRKLGDLAELGFVLDKLGFQKLVKRLPPGLGSRSERWGHTLGAALEAGAAAPASAEELVERHGGAEPVTAPAPAASPAPTPEPAAATTSSPESLEARVARLERQLQALAEQLGASLDEG